MKDMNRKWLLKLMDKMELDFIGRVESHPFSYWNSGTKEGHLESHT